MSPPSRMVQLAVDVANRSPCQKSKRGVVLFRLHDGQPSVTGYGFNGPPGDRPCLGDECRPICRDYCVHAETRAIQRAHPLGLAVPIYAVHVKTVVGQLVAGGGPSCLPCANLVLDARLAGFWLYEAAGGDGAWRCYSAEDFYTATTRAVIGRTL